MANGGTRNGPTAVPNGTAGSMPIAGADAGLLAEIETLQLIQRVL